MVMKKINARYTFQQFNSEVNDLYDYLKSEKWKDEEIQKIFSPLTSKIRKNNTTTYVIGSLLLFSLLIYLLTYFENIYWHISAIGRIGLIKILPFFDWRYLKNKQCLIERFNPIPNVKNAVFNCDLCENLKTIHVYEDIEEEILTKRYLELDVPLILTKGLEKWPRNSEFLEDVIKDDNFYYSYPCKLSTNVHKRTTIAGELFEKIKHFDEFFLHFQNCDLEAMRTFRKYTYRPTFLPSTYSPVLYNWLIWSNSYNATNYKAIDLVEKLAVFGQIFGANYVRLTPRLNCGNICPVLDITLSGGESLIFTNLWDLEYKPKEIGENMAVILETKD